MALRKWAAASYGVIATRFAVPFERDAAAFSSDARKSETIAATGIVGSEICRSEPAESVGSHAGNAPADGAKMRSIFLKGLRIWGDRLFSSGGSHPTLDVKFFYAGRVGRAMSLGCSPDWRCLNPLAESALPEN
jgi:hypothetical protein